MKPQACGLRVASVVFGLVCLAHIVRLLTGTEVVIGSYRLGPVLSVIAIIVSGALSLWLGRMACSACRDAEATCSGSPGGVQ